MVTPCQISFCGVITNTHLQPAEEMILAIRAVWVFHPGTLNRPTQDLKIGAQ